MPTESKDMYIQLRIIKTLSGDRYIYDFHLWGDTIDSVTYQHSLEAERYEIYRDTIRAIGDHIYDYERNLSSGAKTYQEKVSEWLLDVSKMIKKEFLPPSSTHFAKTMREVEKLAKSGHEIVLTITSNCYLVPWWLSNSYISNRPEDSWSVLFSIGFIPAHITLEPTQTRVVKRPRIALISRPSSDLQYAKDIAEKFRELDLVPSANIEVQNGKKNIDRGVGRFGLLREEIKKSLSENHILFYYGHFRIDEEAPEKSYLEALLEYAAGRGNFVPSDRITLDSIKSLISGKILFLNACRSIGLPFLSEKTPFPELVPLMLDSYILEEIADAAVAYHM